MKLDLHKTEWREKLETNLQSAFMPMDKGQFMARNEGLLILILVILAKNILLKNNI